jgi:hypothetical protein
MKLYIETENGYCLNHPAFEDNLIHAFGTIPQRWEPFIRVERPELGVYQKLQSQQPVYAKVNGVWTDVWAVLEMTVEEKTTKQQGIITAFNSREQASNWSAWTLDEATCTMVPPITRPAIDQTKLNAGILTVWSGAENNWKDTPVRPEGNYNFDYISWEWVTVS